MFKATYAVIAKARVTASALFDDKPVESLVAAGHCQ